MSTIAIELNPKAPPMMMRFSLWFVAVVAMALSACTDGNNRSAGIVATATNVLQEVKARKTIRVGVMTDTQPFSFQIGSLWTGFDVEIAHGIANHLGIDKVEFIPLSLDQRSDAVINGTVDMVVASMTVTRYRERRVDFTIPYFQDGMALLVKSSSPIQSYVDLAEKNVGAIKGSTSSYYMTQINPDAKVKTFATNALLREALDKGDVDAITSDYITLVGMVANAKEPGLIRIAGSRLTVEPFAIAVAPNQSAWRNAINHALIALWEKHDWHASADTWFGPGSKYASPVDFVMPVYPK